MTLDDAFGTFILNDRVVISLKGGEMYVIMTWNLFLMYFEGIGPI